MPRRATLLFTCLVAMMAHALARASEPRDAVTLDQAVAELRRVVPGKLSSVERDAKARALDAAWARLRSAPGPAVAALEAEWNRIAAAGERDDYFVIEAAYLVFDIAGPPKLDSVVRMYEGVDLSVNFGLAFQTIARVAATRDPRATPLLRAALATSPETGETAFPQHAMRVAWPVTLEFMLGPYGPGLCGLVADSVARAPTPAVERSAAFVFERNRCLEGLPLARRLAASDEAESKAAGLRLLGALGAPEDRDRIERASGDARADIRHACAYGLYELGDPAGAPTLRSLLADPDERVRGEALLGVFHLIDEEGARAVLARRRAAAAPAERDAIAKRLDELAKESGASAELLGGGDEAAWKEAITAYWRMRDHFFDLRRDDRRLGAAELREALARWDRQRTIHDAESGWIEHRHVLSVATPDDVPALRSLRGRILERHSDEALHELRIIDRLIQVLQRRKVGARKPNE